MKVNGKCFEGNNSNIIELLDTLKIDKSRVVIELNGNIIPKEDYIKVDLKESDTLEVISFVGGG